MSSPVLSRWIVAIVLLASIVIAWRVRRQPSEYSAAYVADRAATVWSTTAQVRQAVATLSHGQRVIVLSRAGDKVQVRTDDGVQGWIDERLLMDAAQWQEVAELLSRARAMPVQAVGHTRVLSNLRTRPGRDTQRIFQLGRNVPVAVLERMVLPAPPPGGTSGEESGRADEENPAQAKQEDWLFVLVAQPEGAGTTPGTFGGADSTGEMLTSSGRSGNSTARPDTSIAGWVLARFITLDPPQPIPDYSSSAGTRVVAWTVLNSVPDAEGEKPQYLVAGTRGGEGQPCDFTTLRVYTWGAARRRYETAYIENNLCGRLPILVKKTSGGTEFSFSEMGTGTGQRVYLMRQTMVRRVQQPDQASSASGERL